MGSAQAFGGSMLPACASMHRREDRVGRQSLLMNWRDLRIGGLALLTIAMAVIYVRDEHGTSPRALAVIEGFTPTPERGVPLTTASEVARVDVRPGMVSVGDRATIAVFGPPRAAVVLTVALPGLPSPVLHGKIGGDGVWSVMVPVPPLATAGSASVTAVVDA